MNSTAKWNDNQTWFRPATAGQSRLVAIVSDGKNRGLVGEDGACVLWPVAGSSFHFIDAGVEMGASAARALSTASAVIFVMDRSDLPDMRGQICQAAMFGPSSPILAVSGLGGSDAARAEFERLSGEFGEIAAELGVQSTLSIPVVLAGIGDVETKTALPSWYEGPQMAELLSNVFAGAGRPEPSFRAVVAATVEQSDKIACDVVSGLVADGDAIKIVPGGRQHEVTTVATGNGSGETVLTLGSEATAKAGDVICAAGKPVTVADQFEASVAWFGAEPMLPGRPYVLQFASGNLDGTLAHPKHIIHLDTLEHLAARTLEPGDFGVCNLSLEADVPFTPFRDNRALGGFTITDKLSNELVGAGTIHFALRRASNIHWQALHLNKDVRSGKLGQKSSVLWFTGLSGSGKSTIANVLEQKLYALGHQTYLLDGDNVRHGLNRDLGFTDADRVENIRRVAEVAKLMADAGLIVLVSFISPFRSERRMARDMMDDGEFIEVFVDTPLDVCEVRDVKGLYIKARRGEIKNFTGIDSDYELPELADIILDTTALKPEQSADEVIAFLDQGGRLKS